MDKTIFLEKIKRLVSESDKNPPQKSKKWISMKQCRIGASEVSNACNCFNSRKSFINNKVKSILYGIVSFKGNEATRFGEKYEPVIRALHEKITNTVVIELNYIIDDKYPFIGVSPDGLAIRFKSDKKKEEFIKAGYSLTVLNNDDIAEIFLCEYKCPYSREIKDKIPDYYLYQILMQMGITGVPECDFVEGQFYEINNIQDLPEEYLYSGGFSKNNGKVFINEKNVTPSVETSWYITKINKIRTHMNESEYHKIILACVETYYDILYKARQQLIIDHELYNLPDKKYKKKLRKLKRYRKKYISKIKNRVELINQFKNKNDIYINYDKLIKNE